MRTLEPIIIAENNVSRAWARAFQYAFSNPHDAGPMTVSFRLPPSGQAEEEIAVRGAVDQALKSAKKVSVTENAAMLFPLRTWQRSRLQGRAAFYEHYKNDVFPRIKARMKGKFYGTYFERLTGFGDGMNQLEHIIEFWQRCAKKNRRPRPSALIAACFDPKRDHTFEPLRGFPCLQQVSFAYDRSGKGLAVSAFYPCQYVFDRGYGNYLGLSHLGKFVAEALQLNLVRVNCFVTAPILTGDVSKTSLASLVRCVERTLAGTPAAA